MKYLTLTNFNYNANPYIKGDILEIEENVNSLIKRGYITPLVDVEKKLEDCENISKDEKHKENNECNENVWVDDSENEYDNIQKEIIESVVRLNDIEIDATTIAEGTKATSYDVEKIAKNNKKANKSLEVENSKKIKDLEEKVKPKKAKLDLKKSEMLEATKKITKTKISKK